MANLDNYLPCEAYAAAPDDAERSGFKTWQDSDNGLWYFGVATNKGRVVLRSEGYTSESGRNNGIESVQRNRDIEERYDILEDGGQWYVILRAGNRQEIARSCAYESESAARAGIAACFSSYVERSSGIQEDYMPCEFYAGRPESEKHPGFDAWKDEESGQHYFALTDKKGAVLLRSEGYKTAAARDNGIESVLRNRDIEERYDSIEENGEWFAILRAGNRQEIARSCACDSDAAARALIAQCLRASAQRSGVQEDYMPCEFYAGRADSEKYPGFDAWKDEESGQYYFALTDKKGAVLLRSEGYKTAAARDNGIESVQRNRDIEERYDSVEENGEWYTILRAGNRQEIARSCAYDSKAAAWAIVGLCNSAYRARAERVEDYLPCEAYANQPAASVEHYTAFTDTETGLHYFALVDRSGHVLLRSEGYTTPGARDNGIQSVEKNHDIEERYKTVKDENDGKWYVSLRAANHQEIARSCACDSEAAAADHLMHCFSRAKLAMLAAGAGEIVEDYLPCEAYANKPASDVKGFTVFQDEKTGLHYFAMTDDNGRVALKSEGYKQASRRDNGIEAVIRNRGIKDHWKEMEDEHGWYMSLRAVNHQEIARSCHHKNKAAMLAWFAPFLAAHAAWGADAEPEMPPATIAPGATATSVHTPAATVPPLTSYTESAAAGSGSSWWKWLLPLLLLLGLLWLLLRGCDGCKAKTPEATAPISTVTPAPMDTAQKAPAPVATPAPAAAPVCNCSGADPLFNLSGGGEPKSLRRLGTNPEFGNSHGLTPEQFFAKLQSRAKANEVDKRFLDRVYKGMGYPEGFAAAKAEQFSAVEVPVGTIGNMGYHTTHKTLYARLDAQGKDLLAFRIKAANGCDMHFMKTCGNHFFFCDK